MSIEPSKSGFSNSSKSLATLTGGILLDKSVYLTTGLIALALICNWVGAIFFYNLDYETLNCFAIGMLIAQPCLIAVWFALGKQRVIVRAPLTIGVLLILLVSFVFSFLNLRTNLPMEIPIIFLAIAAGLFLTIQLPLWIYRRATSQVISRTSSTSNLSAEQFSIKHLLIATTIAAVLFAVGRFAIPDLEFDGGGPIGAISYFLLAYAALVSVLTFLCVGFVFIANKHVTQRIAVGVAIVLTILLVPAFFFMVMRGGLFANINAWEGTFNSVTFSFSLTATMLVVLFAYRALGFRLRTADY
ncbi:MAG: hypothetical protein AB8B55_03450 [Mariniblastus sp.]